MYRIYFAPGFYSAPYHFKELAEMAAKQIPFARVEKTPYFMQPTFTVLHEYNLLKLIKQL